MPFEAGQQLLTYRLMGKDGGGGVGQVWKSLDQAHLRKARAVALVQSVDRRDARMVQCGDREISRDSFVVVLHGVPAGNLDR